MKPIGTKYKNRIGSILSSQLKRDDHRKNDPTSQKRLISRGMSQKCLPIDSVSKLTTRELLILSFALVLGAAISLGAHRDHRPDLSGSNLIRTTGSQAGKISVASKINAENVTSTDQIETGSAKDEKSEQEEESSPPYHSIILQAANRNDMDPALIHAVIMVESAYNPKAISRSGARGLMQLMPRTARALGVKDSLNPEHNIFGGAKYLRQLLDRFNGDVKLALAAYNAGSRNVKKYKGIPPFNETRNFVKKVLSYYEAYRKPITDSENEMV